MKRLLQLTDSKQEEVVKNLLEKHGILYRQSEYGIIDKASLWVMDSDYSKAKELLEAQVSADELLAQVQFEQEWKTKWNRSYISWFIGSIIENPTKLLRLILLVIFLCIFVWYPIYTLFSK